MASPLVILIAVLFFIFYIYKFCVTKPKNFPPGPIRLPIFGSYLQILLKDYYKPYNAIIDWSKKFQSSVIGLYYGNVPVVFIGDLDGIREMSNRQEFDGRPFSAVAQSRSWNKRLGIFFTEGSSWLEQRRYTLRHLRDFGFGRRFESLEKLIDKEITSFLDIIKTGPVNPDDKVLFDKDGNIAVPDLFYAGFINSYVRMIHGKTLERSDYPKMREVAKGAFMFQLNTDAIGFMFGLLPALQYVCPELSSFKDMYEGNQILVNFVKDLLKDRKENSNEEDEGFFDSYLKELESKNGKKGSNFTEDQLIMIATDLLLPTASAVHSAMAYVILELMENPDADEMIFREIKKIVGFERLPNLNDRTKLPYLEACLRETLRKHSITPFGVPHTALVNTTFRNYFIPKGTVIIPNMVQANTDPKTWDEPEKFKPERFLDSFGYIKKGDITIPFGIGRRVCAGETYARQTMFLFLAGLLQHYKPVLPDEYKYLSIRDISKHGLIQSPKEFKVKFVPRQWKLYVPSRYY